jgi:peptidoglycan hydrolase-like protein with peptidoglycan-binding domain
MANARILGLTSPLITGPEVRSAQQLLQKNPWKQDYLQDDVDGVFGPATARACKRAKYWLGFTPAHMKPTFGPDLRGLLDQTTPLPPLYRTRREERLKKTNTLPARAFEIATDAANKGIKEDPGRPNQVFFSRWYGMPGQPWCCMFVTYCYVNAGSKAFQRRGRWAYCFHVSAAAREGRHNLAVTKNPQRGDVVVFGPPDYKDGHIGFFDAWIDRGRGTFKTIEGNASDMVKRCNQHVGTVDAFVHVGG